MDIKKIIKESLLNEDDFANFKNPLRGTGVERASGESEVRAASRFTLDRIKDSFRKSGIYLDDDYLSSFIPISLIKNEKKPFEFKFKILDDEEEGVVYEGRAKFNSIKGSTLILEFISKDNKKFFIAFKGNGKDSLDRTFMIKQKMFQKVRKGTDMVIKGLQRGGKFNVKILNVTEDETPSIEGIEEVPTNKISLITIGIQTSIEENEKDEFILPTTSDIKDGIEPFIVVGRFTSTDSGGLQQLDNELKNLWGNKMRAWASDKSPQIMLQISGKKEFVVVQPENDRIKKYYKDINNYDDIEVIIGPKAFENRNITKGIKGKITLEKVD